MAIKISGSTIIDDSRVIVNADKIGIGTLGPSRDLEIYSDVALVSDFPSAGIAVSATTSLTSNTPKAFQVFNNSSTTQVAISYTGRIDANEYFGTFKGTIDAGVAVGSADQLKVTHSNTNATFTLPFVDDSAANNSYQSFLIDSNASTSLLFNPSTGHLQINGTGKGLLTLRTTDNTSDRGIAFQNSGNNYTASIYAEDIGNSSVDLVFLVDDTNETSLSSLDERMRITNDGKLLIGVNASSQADANLQVFRPTGTTSRIQIGNVATSASGVAGIDFCPSNKVMGSRIECHATEDFSSSANRTADLVFITRKDGTFSEKLRITSGGDVGIGTDNPIGTNALTNNTRTLAVGILTATQIFGPVKGALEPTGSVIIDENLTVKGNTTLGDSDSDLTTIKGNLTLEDADPVITLIDTTNNSDFRLQAQQGLFRIQDATNGNADRLVVNSSGFVAIGTTDPKSKLHVENTIGTATTVIISQQKTYGVGSGTAERARLDLAIREANTTADNRIFGRMETGPESETTSEHSFLTFSTRRSGSISERLRITSGGVVNIGTNNLSQSTYKFQVETGTNKFISFDSGGHSDFSDEGASILFSRPSDGAKELSGLMSITNGGLLLGARGEIVFATGGGSTFQNTDEGARITSDGDVGIGTNNPKSKYM